MTTYHKIDSIYKRDMEGSKKLIEGEFRDPLVEYLKDNIWLWSEKIDGTNIRVHWDGYNVSIYGRTDNAQIPAHLLNDELTPAFGTNEAEEIFEQKFGEMPVTLYGEGYGKKIQKGGGLYSDTPRFALFDVMVGMGKIMLDREAVESIAQALGVDAAPLVMRDTIEAAVEYVKSGPASLLAAQNRPMEGLVGTPAQRILDHRAHRVIVKIKAEDFIPKDKNYG